MIRQHRYKAVLLGVLCCIVWAACTQQRQPCLTPKIASMNLECMHFATDTSLTAVDSAPPSPVFVALTNSGPDTIPYAKQANFTLSLSSDSTVCKWLFTTDTVNAKASYFDTLTFYYKRNLQFLSNACGYAYFYGLDSVHTTYKMIDSVRITNAGVTNNVNIKHLQVFIRRGF